MTSVSKRPSVDQYYITLAFAVATRSTCLRHDVGAIFVLDKQILSTGYNGAPTGLANCLDIGCIRIKKNIPSGTQHECCRAVHAEQNAIIQAAKHGVRISGATLYCTHQPCILCTKMLINAEIKKVVYAQAYPDNAAIDMLHDAGILVEKFEGVY